MPPTDLIGGKTLEPWAPLIKAIPQGHGVALAGFSETADCGDHAIWLGEKALLTGMGVETLYQCSPESYDPQAMRAKLGKGAILLHGRSYMARPSKAKDLALRIIEDFPGNRIVVLPRSIAQTDDVAFQALAIAAEASGNDLAVFASTSTSRDMLARHFGPGVETTLVPDLAFVLGPQAKLAEPNYDIIWLARTDAERHDETEAVARLASQSAEKFMLPDFSDGVAFSFVIKHRPPTILLSDWQSLVFDNQEARLALKDLPFDSRAEAYLRRVNYILALGHLVITDRLHAHILATQLGIPHILVNTRSGRNAEFHRQWTQNAALCRLADTPAEAWAMARTAVTEIKDMKAKGENWSWR